MYVFIYTHIYPCLEQGYIGIGTQEVLNSDLLLRPILCDVYAHVCAPVCQQTTTQGDYKIVSDLSG